MADAIVRTLVRLLITRKHLLEWQTAAQVKADRGLDLRGFYRQMAGSVGLAVGIGVLGVIAEPGAAWIVAPFVALWLAAPWIARQISLPGAISEPAASVAIRTSTRCVASPVAPGCSSRRSSPPTNTVCRPTTTRTTRNR